jgi:hypothetical protein
MVGALGSSGEYSYTHIIYLKDGPAQTADGESQVARIREPKCGPKALRPQLPDHCDLWQCGLNKFPIDAFGCTTHTCIWPKGFIL